VEACLTIIVSIAERIVYITLAFMFHDLTLSLDNMTYEKGLSDGLLELFPGKNCQGLTVISEQRR
jgi:hypothetical protein